MKGLLGGFLRRLQDHAVKETTHHEADTRIVSPIPAASWKGFEGKEDEEKTQQAQTDAEGLRLPVAEKKASKNFVEGNNRSAGATNNSCGFASLWCWQAGMPQAHRGV